MSRNVSILSVMVMMTVTVMATVSVAFAIPNEGGNGQVRVEVCHKGKIITVAQPALEAHERHGDNPTLCENEEAPPVPPELTTVATGATLGNPISDTATLSGATSDATGTMTFKLYGPFTDPITSTDTCVDPDPANNVAGTLVTMIDVPLPDSPDASGNYVVSGDYTPLTVGRYQWVVSYSGDANNEAVSSECKAPNEASVVTEATATSTTE